MSNELEAYIASTPDGTGLADYYLKTEVDKVIAEKDAQILDLIEQVQKERSAKVDYKISANDLSGGLKKAYEEIRRLNRALYKACANWAICKACILECFCIEINAKKWERMHHKCRAKAEEYR